MSTEGRRVGILDELEVCLYSCSGYNWTLWGSTQLVREENAQKY